MINQGTMFLIDRKGETVTAKMYRNPKGRQLIQKEWKALYGGNYNNCYLQISPAVDTTKVNPDGTNRKEYQERKRKNK